MKDRQKRTLLEKILREVIRTPTASPFQAGGLSIPQRIHSGKGQKALLTVAILLF